MRSRLFHHHHLYHYHHNTTGSPGRRTRVGLVILVTFTSISFLDWVVAFAAHAGWMSGSDGNKGPQFSSHSKDCLMTTTTTDSDIIFSSSNASLVDFVEIVDDFGNVALVNQRINGGDNDGNNILIRLEKGPDDATRQDLSSMDRIQYQIQKVRNEQNAYGRSDLYERHWEPCRRHRDDDDDGPARCCGNNATTTTTCFTVMQFNMLAEGLSSDPTKCPFKDDDNDNKDRLSPVVGYGGFTRIPHPFVTLDFARRKWRLVEILLGPKTNHHHQNDTTTVDDPIDHHHHYDIIGLQEVDRYRGFFGPLLNRLGYQAIFVPKTNSPGVRMGWYSDGCVLAWKSETFHFVHEISGDYTVGNQVYVIATLQHKRTRKYMIVAVTHLKAQQSEINEVVRCRQVDELLAAIDVQVQRLVESFPGEQAQIIVMGDLNADPPSVVAFNCSAVQKLLTHRHSTIPSEPYRSAYLLDDDDNPLGRMFTTWKIRGSTESKRIIDYICYAGSSLQCVATYATVRPKELDEAKLPSLRHPSDHLHIAAKFELL